MPAKWKYLPILKWKQGERIALSKLTDAQWDGMVPLIEILPIDPKKGTLSETLVPYITKIGGQMTKSIPEGTPIAIDIRYFMPTYAKQTQVLTSICKRLTALTGRQIIPVITEAMVARPADLPDLAKAFEVFVLRIQTHGVTSDQVKDFVKVVVGAGIAKSRLHVLVDQFSIVGVDPAACAAAAQPYLDEALAAGCSSTTLGGGSFPLNLVGRKQGLHDIERVEWKAWKSLVAKPAYAKVLFSDYTVSNPAPAPDIDPTMMNPSVAIRYASDGFWRLFKAGGFKKGKQDQYKNLCILLKGDPVYSGAAFSFGDDCYDKASVGVLGNGNPTSWRRDAASHHLVFTSSAI